MADQQKTTAKPEQGPPTPSNPEQGPPTPANAPAPETASPIAPPKPAPTIDELKIKLNAMVDAGNFGSDFATLSKTLASAHAKIEADQRDATQIALKEVTNRVQSAIVKAIEPFLAEIDAKGGDGVWFVSDWGEALIETRMMKARPATKKSSSGGSGGGGKKFSISTDELLKEHGHKEYKDGVSYQQAYDADTGGNARYQVRVKLLKEAGLTG